MNEHCIKEKIRQKILSGRFLDPRYLCLYDIQALSRTPSRVPGSVPVIIRVTLDINKKINSVVNAFW
jgi:hypothetical protein